MTRRLSVVLSLAAVLALPALAQQKDKTPPAGQPPQMSAEDKAMMEAFERMGRVGENHKLLEPMAGEWSAKVTMWMKPGVPPMESAGSMATRSVYGGRYYHAVYKGEMMGTPFEGAATTGYDNLTGKFWNTWVDSMSTGLAYMTGTYDPASKSITFNGEWPDPMNPKTMTKVREVFRIGEADRHVMEMYEMRDGKEFKSMEIVYTRKK